ncbi:MAG: DegV family protein [Ignavibacteriales bacterium]
MAGISVVTDSTSDISPQTAAGENIVVVPLSVLMGGRSYLDGVDITPSQFYPMLEASRELPKTSQVTPEHFISTYKPLLDSGNSVVSVHISGGLSSTVESARAAARSLDPSRIRVVDSRSISYGIGFLALEARRAVREGLGLDAIAERLDRVRKTIEVFFTLDTLEYLHKGGRIGKVAALLGGLLDIKPVIRVEDGIYVPAGKVRTRKQAMESLLQHVKEKAAGRPVRVAVGHGRAAEAASTLREMVKRSLHVCGDVSVFEVGPVIGSHTGPGTLGIAMQM